MTVSIINDFGVHCEYKQHTLPTVMCMYMYMSKANIGTLTAAAAVCVCVSECVIGICVCDNNETVNGHYERI